MITPAKIRFVIDTFKTVIKKYPTGELNMMEGEVNMNNHKCGTVHCHGGWYALERCDLSEEITFWDGAEQLSKDLGLKNSNNLELWASKNIYLWGNKYGMSLFSSKLAFKSSTRPNGVQNLQDIIDHWQEVHDRFLLQTGDKVFLSEHKYGFIVKESNNRFAIVSNRYSTYIVDQEQSKRLKILNTDEFNGFDFVDIISELPYEPVKIIRNNKQILWP